MDRTARRTHRWITALTLVACTTAPLAACAQVPASTHKTVEPVVSEPIGNTGVKRLTLTDQAVERLAVETSLVTDSQGRLVIPYAALLYLPDGTAFVYTNPEGRSYVREPVAVERIQGAQVVLTSGPAPGTRVVTAGGAELWGAEFGIK
jgi:multidrug efflux pump subunit AcrA (membrane-fusion protein)